MNASNSVIFIDDEKHLCMANRQTLELAGFDVQCFSNLEQVIPLLARSLHENSRRSGRKFRRGELRGRAGTSDRE